MAAVITVVMVADVAAAFPVALLTGRISVVWTVATAPLHSSALILCTASSGAIIVLRV